MTEKMKKPAKWQVRRVLYGLTAVVVAVLGYLGILSEVKAEDVMAQADQIIPVILGVLAPALAAAKTNPGSDARPADAAEVADRVVARLGEAAAGGRHAEKPIDSVGAYYAEQGGRRG